MTTLHLGPLRLENTVFLAPMTGITDRPFRRAVRRFGAGLVFSEMIASRMQVDELKGSAKASQSYLDEQPMGVQLAGCEPEVMAEAARINAGRGAGLIDLNFGCPVKKVVNRFSGSAIMRDEKLAGEIMRTIAKAVDVPVTVKMRLGWDDDSRNAVTLARMAEDAGLKMITIHGRTRQQMYTGRADWAAVRAIKEAVKLPVIVNGDITCGQKAAEALRQSGADGVMIGRGAQGKPWLMQQIAAHLSGQAANDTPAGTSLRDTILAHYQELLSHHGTHIGMLNGRKHIGWYLKDHAGSDALRTRINTCDDPAQVMAYIRDYFETDPVQPPPSA